MILFLIVFPAIFILFGIGSVFVAVRSWRGTGPRPSKSILFVGVAVTRRPDFVDRCALPFGLLFLCLGGMLLTAPLVDHSSSNIFFDATFGVLAVAVISFAIMTFTVYRFERPRFLSISDRGRAK